MLRVVPNIKEGGWSVETDGGATKRATFPTKENALQAARRLSRRRNEDVVIHTVTGEVEEIRTVTGDVEEVAH